MKKALPAGRDRGLERNRPDDTFGWGVVFSDETLGNFEEADPASLRARSATQLPLLGRHRDLLRRRPASSRPATASAACRARRCCRSCRSAAASSASSCASSTRSRGLDELRAAPTWSSPPTASTARCASASPSTSSPTLDWRKCKFCWLGTDQAAATPSPSSSARPSTACSRCTPTRSSRRPRHLHRRVPRGRSGGAPGSTSASEEETVALLRASSSPSDLDGHRLLANRSIWRTFPTVRCERWHHDNIVLLGDAAHTAHFSIGSGTKLAMEDAIALVDALRAPRAGRRPGARSRPTRRRAGSTSLKLQQRGADQPRVVRELERATWARSRCSSPST